RHDGRLAGSRDEFHRRDGPLDGRRRGGPLAMAKHGKKYAEGGKLIDPLKRYSVEEACAIVGKTAKSNFKFAAPKSSGKTAKKERKSWDETVDVAIRLGVDPKHADQMVR